jgi:hypothetical protein
MTNDGNSGRKTGRPQKGEHPRVPYELLDRILVFGEEVPCEDGKSTTVVFPSYRELGERFNVAHSLIAQYSRKHNCMGRREAAAIRVAATVDQKIVEMRANALALTKEDTLRMIDGYLMGFEKALADGRIRYDNPTDFNTMVRLKEYVMGGADSRQEVHAALSLEDLQARHRRMLQREQEKLEDEEKRIKQQPAVITEHSSASNSPDSPLLNGVQKLSTPLLKTVRGASHSGNHLESLEVSDNGADDYNQGDENE